MHSRKCFHSCSFVQFLQHPQEVDVRVEGSETQGGMKVIFFLLCKVSVSLPQGCRRSLPSGGGLQAAGSLSYRASQAGPSLQGVLGKAGDGPWRGSALSWVAAVAPEQASLLCPCPVSTCSQCSSQNEHFESYFRPCHYTTQNPPSAPY